eukprot:79816-Rhodomonas_salina.2
MRYPALLHAMHSNAKNRIPGSSCTETLAHFLLFRRVCDGRADIPSFEYQPVLAVLCTAQFQIWQGTKQKLYKLSPIQVRGSRGVRVCYAKSGTEIAYGATMSGIEIAYGATR